MADLSMSLEQKEGSLFMRHLSGFHPMAHLEGDLFPMDAGEDVHQLPVPKDSQAVI